MKLNELDVSAGDWVLHVASGLKIEIPVEDVQNIVTDSVTGSWVSITNECGQLRWLSAGPMFGNTCLFTALTRSNHHPQREHNTGGRTYGNGIIRYRELFAWPPVQFAKERNPHEWRIHNQHNGKQPGGRIW